MWATKLRLIPAVFLLLLTTGCSFGAPPPPSTAGSAPPPSTELSEISTPISIYQEPVRAALERALKTAPLAEGQTAEIDARAFVNEKTIIQEPKQIIETPYKAAFCEIKKIQELVTDHVKVGTQAYGCWLNPLKWGKCWKDVFKDITRVVEKEVKQCVPEQLEVVRTVISPVVHLKEAILPTKVRLRYRVDLDHLALSMVGDSLSITPYLKTTIDADLREGFLNSSVLIKGALQCRISISPTVEARLFMQSISEDIRANVEIKSISLDLTKLCVPGAIETLDLALLVNPLNSAIAKTLSDTLNSKLTEELQKQMDKSLAGVRLVDSLRALVEPSRSPIELAPNVWLVANAQQLSVSQLTGGEVAGTATFDIVAALTAAPVAFYGSKPVIGPLSPLPVVLRTTGDRFHLVPTGVIPLAEIQQRLNETVAAFIAKEPAKYRHIDASVDVYQSGPRLVLALKIHKHSFPSAKGTVYLVGDPEFDASANELRLKDLKFDVASRNVVVKSAAWLIDGKVEDYLQAHARFSVGKPLASILKEVGAFSTVSPTGVFSGHVDEIALGQVWLDSNSLNFTVSATGSTSFKAKLP